MADSWFVPPVHSACSASLLQLLTQCGGIAIDSVVSVIIGSAIKYTMFAFKPKNTFHIQPAAVCQFHSSCCGDFPRKELVQGDDHTVRTVRIISFVSFAMRTSIETK